jgi:hypothetical protein
MADEAHPGVSHFEALPSTLKNTLRQKKNYGNSNIFTMQKYNFPQESF